MKHICNNDYINLNTKENRLIISFVRDHVFRSIFLPGNSWPEASSRHRLVNSNQYNTVTIQLVWTKSNY